MTAAFERSFKEHLNLVARERHFTPAEVWHNVIAERFLVRLCKSPYRSRFILKGGCLLARHIEIGRETKDIDFAIQRLSNEATRLQKVFAEIAAVHVDDGFLFSNPAVSSLDHLHMPYRGAHVNIEAYFGKFKFLLPVDLGFGDQVNVQEKEILLLSSSKGPLFEQSLTLNCYPMEFIFAEKLETAIFRGVENTRMKDYHDLYTLVSSRKALHGEKTESAVRAVFSHRKTVLALPIRFSVDICKVLQTHWGKYRQAAMNLETLPSHIDEVIARVNQWLVSNTGFR